MRRQAVALGGLGAAALALGACRFRTDGLDLPGDAEAPPADAPAPDGKPPPPADAAPIDAAGPDARCDEIRDTNPSCPAASPWTLAGDAADTFSDSGAAEAWYLVHLDETVNPPHDLTARVDLQSPPGVDFDLYVYCWSCGGSLAASSEQPAGLLDTVLVGRADGGGDSGWDFLVEIRYYSGAGACGAWTLTVTGDAGSLTGC